MGRESGDANDQQQRLMLRGLALLALLMEVGVAIFLWQVPGSSPRLRHVLVGLAVTLLLVLVTAWPRVSVAVIQRAVVGLAAFWMLVNIYGVITTHRAVPSGVLLHMVVVGLLAFSWLPPRWAIGTVAVTYGLLCVAGTFSVEPDGPGLVVLGFIIPLTWYLTLHGDEVRTERRRSETLAELASTDPLTGVYNRRAGEQRLYELSRRWRHMPTRLSVAMFDLDHFKRINDSLGHARGDDVLILFARILQEHTRPGDVVVRWGGEEFLVVLAGIKRRDAREVGLRILEEVRTAQVPGCPSVTVSGGLASLNEAPVVAGLVELADRRLYQAKAGGRDRLV